MRVAVSVDRDALSRPATETTLNVTSHIIKTILKMNFIEIAIRRLLIRKTEKVIIAGLNSVSNATEHNKEVVLPTIPNLIWNVFSFWFILFILIAFFLGMGIGKIAYLIPLILIMRIIRPLRGFTYDLKNEAIHKSDKRYSTGQRVTGWKLVEDKNKKIEFSEKQKLIAKIEAGLKIFVVIYFTVYTYQSINSIEYTIDNLTTEQLIKHIKPGDTLISKRASISMFGKFKSDYGNQLNFEDFGESESKIIGIYKGIDSFANDTKLLKSDRQNWIVVEPLNPIKRRESYLINMKNRIDSTTYIRIDDFTISPYTYNKK